MQSIPGRGWFRAQDPVAEAVYDAVRHAAPAIDSLSHRGTARMCYESPATSPDLCRYSRGSLTDFGGR